MREAKIVGGAIAGGAVMGAVTEFAEGIDFELGPLKAADIVNIAGAIVGSYLTFTTAEETIQAVGVGALGSAGAYLGKRIVETIKPKEEKKKKSISDRGWERTSAITIGNLAEIPPEVFVEPEKKRLGYVI